MAKLKPMNPTINYERAWKELKKGIGEAFMEGERNIFYGRQIKEIMDDFEKKHKNLITPKRRSDPEIVDYCIKKSVETRMENIYLKKELRGLKKRKLIDVHMECMEMGKSGFVRDGDCVKEISGEFDVNEMMSIEQYEYYHNAIMEGKIVNYKGKKIRVTKICIPEGD